jgi:hypothetical protein
VKNSEEAKPEMNPLQTFCLLLIAFMNFEASTSSYTNGKNLKLVSEWKSIDFNFPTETLRRDSMSKQNYIPGNAVPIDVDVHYKGENDSI